MLDEMTFSRDDFTRSNWRDIISSAESPRCDSYSRLFSEASKKAHEDGDVPLSQVFFLLYAVCYLWLRPDEPQPFAPFWQGADGSRSVDISDFSESHVNLLKEFVGQIDDPELRSRIGDVIWTIQHHGNFTLAEIAVDAYLQVGEGLLLSDDYYFGVERFTRAIHLAASLGRNSRKFGEVVAKIDALINQYASEYRPFVGRLLDLLYEYRQGDFGKNASIAQSLAEFDQKRREWHFARAHWNAAAKWYRLSENPEAAQKSQLEEAECYVFEAEDTMRTGREMNRSVAAHHLQSAIEAFRRIPGTEDRQKELHSQMLRLQESSRNELSGFSQEVDLTEHVERALQAVRGKPFLEALFAFCLIGSPANVKNLRDYVERNAAKHPLTSWISSNIVDERGRVVGRRGSLFSGSPEEIESAKIAEMHHWARYEQDALAVIVNAARLQLIVEHKFELRDFLELTTNHPFIPLGRELIFSRGFQAGFQGDFLEALHLLIPQVENSLRYILNEQGVITSKLSSEGIQEELDINDLLGKPELKEILGEDLVFDLQGTLTNRFGSNFRNLMAHGLLDQQAFYSYSAIYIWWLLLRICGLPLIITQYQEENKDAVTPSQ